MVIATVIAFLVRILLLLLDFMKPRTAMEERADGVVAFTIALT